MGLLKIGNRHLVALYGNRPEPNQLICLSRSTKQKGPGYLPGLLFGLSLVLVSLSHLSVGMIFIFTNQKNHMRDIFNMSFAKSISCLVVSFLGMATHGTSTK
jgi:hypothetical protein